MIRIAVLSALGGAVLGASVTAVAVTVSVEPNPSSADLSAVAGQVAEQRRLLEQILTGDRAEREAGRREVEDALRLRDKMMGAR